MQKEKREILDFFNKNFRKGTIKIIKKSEIKEFLKNNKKVYPKEVIETLF